MSLAQVHSRALNGLDAPAVTVEVHLANGLPSFTLVGLADVEVKEARERVRSALLHCGLEFVHNKRITVNLAPADLPKDSGRFDLPIALGMLAASGQIDGDKLADYEFAGELSLSGQLRPIRGALAMSLARQTQQVGRKLVLPTASAQEAALVPGAEVYACEHLLDVLKPFLHDAQHGKASLAIEGNGHDKPWQPLTPATPDASTHYPDMGDVKGQIAAKRALQIAAAGGHSVLMVGPPGSGKSMLAQRFAGLLPPMDVQQSLESAAIASLAGRFSLHDWGKRPTSAPHHSASAVALVGGGSPPKPGEISLAHHGVLFLDELPEFPRNALEALREPLENGHIRISRAHKSTQFPAQFQLLAAMNPCPCGYLGARIRPCRCTPEQVKRYQAKLSGPLLDRIDLHVEVPAVAHADLLRPTSNSDAAPANTHQLKMECDAARSRALERQGNTNAALQGAAIDAHCRLNEHAAQFLAKASEQLGWSARAAHRAIKIARTIADLAYSADIEVNHIAEAMQYRRALVNG